MRSDTVRWVSCRLGCLLATALAAGCVTPAGRRAPPAAPVQAPEGEAASQAFPPSRVASTPSRATRCPPPDRIVGPYDLSKLPAFSKALFYMRENSPVDISPRAREMVVGALQAVALQDSDITVEGDSAKPPRWVTVTVSDERCTLNLDRVDAPWMLRTTLQNALRFVQGNLRPAAPGVDAAERLFRLEIAATNGMLAAFDGRSALLDVETYKKVRPGLVNGREPAKANGDAAHLQEGPSPKVADGEAVSVETGRLAAGYLVGYAHLASFRPGASGEVERWLATFDPAHLKGIVLDLRDNSGGVLSEAISVADAFIKQGSLGAALNRDRGSPQRKEFVARENGHEPAGAIVVLVNHQTASASELVAAAIKNLGRGIVMGEPTAGAATIRVLFDIPKGPMIPVIPAAPRRANSDRDIIQDVIDGKAPAPPPPPPTPVQPLGDPEMLGLVLATGRLLASGGAEIDGVGVTPDLQPSCPAGERVRGDEDCLLVVAREVIARAKDGQRSTLLSTAKELAASGSRPGARSP
jgi:hypothetical protein